MTTIKHIDIAEFRALGYVQEINRLVLHPAGLALEVTRDDETGAEHISGVWDYREDPEGIYFDGDYADMEAKAERVAAITAERAPARERALGYVVQPPRRPPIR